MKTDHFKMQFQVLNGIRVTRFTFGYTEVLVSLISDNSYTSGVTVEQFALSYKNNGQVKLMCNTYDLPTLLSNSIRNLYYGSFLELCVPFNKTPALTVISTVRSVMNFYKRIGKDLV